MRTIDIKKILVPTDFSDAANTALLHAVKMAKDFDAGISLLHVVSTFSHRINLPEVIELERTQNNKLSGAIKDKLESLAEPIRKSEGIAVETMIVPGRVREEIVGVAEDIYADVIIMGTHGVSGLKEFFIGSNAFRVVMEAGCPVLSIQKDAKNLDLNDIVVPIDNSFHSREKIGIAVQLAKVFNATLHICGLRSHDHEDENINAKFQIKLDKVGDYLREKEVTHHIDLRFCTNIAKETIDYARQKNAGMIIIMNEQELNDAGFFVGGYAQQIVNHSRIPVLSIRPEVGKLNDILP